MKNILSLHQHFSSMSIVRFLFSKVFLRHLALAVILVLVVAFAALYWLDFTTNHDQKIEVPNIAKMSLEEAETALSELDLRLEILDSANYNPDYPKFSVIDQIPEAGSDVKENRKIYITLNPSGYRKVVIPPLVGSTRRQAEPTLRGLGFEIGEITYKPDMAKDEVLQMLYSGKPLEAGDELQITSVIDLVLGDGELRYGQSADAIEAEEPQTASDE